ncbi:MAG TPA: oligopeptide/dipeptide ABC transporter ATP-binding protein [Thermodesulfobacteriota bacterium]|nr:oligopeptide/dipeptide ABC transporter ATP-binding protein [Thermodesulfobacteriota bacterium]
MSEPLLRVENLKKYFPVEGKIFSGGKEFVRAVDGVSFEIQKGETLSLVGESGCGKTTAGKSILRLIEPTAGNIWLGRTNIGALSQAALRRKRKNMQIIFQDPYSSLNPRMTVGRIIGEALSIHGLTEDRNREQKVVEILEMVGMGSGHLDRYPHEFSGGQRQRIGIARALAVGPELIVADEPISSLDVSIQAQIINLLEDLQRKMGLTFLFISHNLNVVAHISDHVAVMYLGKIIEMAPASLLYREPLHPYTLALLSSVPVPDPSLKREEIILQGEVPSPINPPSGCRFHPRCSYRKAECVKEEPTLKETKPGHHVACVLH